MTWTLICPAEDAKSARTISDADKLALERAGKQLGLRVTVDEDRRKFYLGLPLATKAPAPSAPEAVLPKALPVPYFAQYDSGTNQGPRMCFSSSCAMLAKFLKPGSLSSSANADDEYLVRVRSFGDTTEASAQLSALAFLGIKAAFRQRLGWSDLDAQLRKGVPVPIGILHHGPASAPSGGGHWILVIGREGEAYRVHDPAGELDLVAGGYGLGRPGNGVLYSKANLGPRWMAEGPNTGWGILA